MAQELDREKMKAVRKAKGLNQTDAADKAGMSGGAPQWSDIESGRKPNVTVETLSRIAAALDVDARELLTPRKNSRRKGK
jgi:transcriptional regulator with XRE-family HTH domain